MKGMSKPFAPFIGAKLCDENVPNYTAAMYQTIRRQCTKLYGGNLPNCTTAITKLYGGNWRSGRGGTLTKYPGKSRKPKTHQRDIITTKTPSSKKYSFMLEGVPSFREIQIESLFVLQGIFLCMEGRLPFYGLHVDSGRQHD